MVVLNESLRLFQARPDETTQMRENRVTTLMHQMTTLINSHHNAKTTTVKHHIETLSGGHLDVPIELHTHTAMPFSPRVKSRVLTANKKGHVNVDLLSFL